MRVNEILKSKREQKHMTIQSVRKDTRIAPAYIEALEAGDWKVFPAETYLLGFLKTYSLHLGLDPAEMVGLYKQELAAALREQDAKIQEEREVRQQEDSNSRVKAVVLLLVLLVVSGWWLISVLGGSRPAGERREVLKVRKAAAVQAAVKPEEKPEEGLRLEIEALESVWVRVIGDKKLVYEGFLPAKLTRSWNMNTEVVLRIGDTNAVRLRLNGKALNPSVGADRSVNDIKLTPASLNDASLLLPQEPAAPDVVTVPAKKTVNPKPKEKPADENNQPR